MAKVIMEKNEVEVSVWLDRDAENLQSWSDYVQEAETEIAIPPPPSPTFTTSEDTVNSLVIEWLRGPSGPPGPMGAMGAKGELG